MEVNLPLQQVEGLPSSLGLPRPAPPGLLLPPPHSRALRLGLRAPLFNFWLLFGWLGFFRGTSLYVAQAVLKLIVYTRLSHGDSFTCSSEWGD